MYRATTATTFSGACARRAHECSFGAEQRWVNPSPETPSALLLEAEEHRKELTAAVFDDRSARVAEDVLAALAERGTTVSLVPAPDGGVWLQGHKVAPLYDNVKHDPTYDDLVSDNSDALLAYFLAKEPARLIREVESRRGSVAFRGGVPAIDPARDDPKPKVFIETYLYRAVELGREALRTYVERG